MSGGRADESSGNGRAERVDRVGSHRPRILEYSHRLCDGECKIFAGDEWHAGPAERPVQLHDDRGSRLLRYIRAGLSPLRPSAAFIVSSGWCALPKVTQERRGSPLRSNQCYSRRAVRLSRSFSSRPQLSRWARAPANRVLTTSNYSNYSTLYSVEFLDNLSSPASTPPGGSRVPRDIKLESLMPAT